jgi:hypothetical protein
MAAALAAPALATAVVLGVHMPAAAAATGQRSDTFRYTSARTGAAVSCTIDGSFGTTPRSGGGFTFDAYVRITAASSSECFDGLVDLRARHHGAPDDEYVAGGSLLQVTAATPNDVTSVSYTIYFNGCGCSTPAYTSPK